jgi:UDP-glucuronate decarboxylase
VSREVVEGEDLHATARDKSTALVTGGAGFLGSHLCERLLAEGINVVCLDNLQTGRLDNLSAIMDSERFTFFEADVIDELPPEIAARPYSEIFHLACAASPPAYQADPEHTMLTCVIGTLRMLKLAERTGARLLFTSTSEIYGDPLEHPQREGYRGNVNPIGPRACYDEGKRAGETLCFDYDRAGRAEVRVARIFNTYGPRLRAEDGRVVSNLIVQALGEQPLTLYGTGEQTRSFCYVDDQIAGLLALARSANPQPGPVNIGNPSEITVRELADRVVAITGSSSRIVHEPLPTDDPQRRRPDIGKAARVLGWSPMVDLDEGLAGTIRWFAEQIEAPATSVAA